MVLACVSFYELARHRYVMSAFGHICALWAICWLGARISARSLLWLPVALLSFAIAWFMYPIVFIILLALIERISRVPATDTLRGQGIG